MLGGGPLILGGGPPRMLSGGPPGPFGGRPPGPVGRCGGGPPGMGPPGRLFGLGGPLTPGGPIPGPFGGRIPIGGIGGIIPWNAEIEIIVKRMYQVLFTGPRTLECVWYEFMLWILIQEDSLFSSSE